MISQIYIITKNGDLCYSKSFFKERLKDNDTINFLTSVHKTSKKIGGGNVRSLNFTNFNFVYSYDTRDYMYIIITDSNDNEEESRARLDLLKKEFCEKYPDVKEKWSTKTKHFEPFDEFIEKFILLPPKILLLGEDGVGKSTIMDLFPGETILELDNDMNEIVQKTVRLSNFEPINEVTIREIRLQDSVNNPQMYKPILDSADIICIITNSGAVNLSRTNNLYTRLKPRVKKADFYIIANFQDSRNSAFEPAKIKEAFGVKTFGFSAVQEDARENIYVIIKRMLEISYNLDIRAKKDKNDVSIL